MSKLKKKRWPSPSSYDRNLIVIGAGAGGLVSAYIAATVKAKVSLVEAHKMGGDCLNTGCVPSKALIKIAKIRHQLHHANQYGFNVGEVSIDFPKVMQQVQKVIQAVEPHDSIERYTKLGVEVIQGYAKLIDPWTVEIALNNGQQQCVTTRSIIIATGAQPFIPPIEGLNHMDYLTSDNLWSVLSQQPTLPKNWIVLGGGPIGCELSQALSRLGANVTQVEMLPRLMIREDADVSEWVRTTFEQEGIEVLTEHKALRCYQQNQKNYLVVEYQGQEKTLVFDQFLCAVGRRARLQGYGLETLGIDTKRTITTNQYLQTLYPNIYAVGDVAGPYQFTHTAAHQAWYASVNALFGHFKSFKVDYSVIPWTTFLDPEIARVGLNEQEAKQKNMAYEVSYYGMDDLDRAITDGVDYGFIKVLTVPKKDKILGVTMVGEHAGDLLAEFVLAMKHGLGLNKILGTIHTYPTFAEANKYVAGVWKKTQAPKKLLQWLERYHQWRCADK